MTYNLKLKTQRGISLLVIVISILLMGVFATILISQLGSGVSSTVNEQGASQALYIAEGAQEMAARFLIDNSNFGENGAGPQTVSFPDTTLGQGSFTVSSFYPLTFIANASTSFMTSTAASVTVNVTSAFPSSGRLKIDLETMTYTGKTATSFTGLTRRTDGTTATAHYQRSPVFPATVLTAAILAAGTTIPVSTTVGFLESGTLRIEQELMDYSGVTSTSFTGLTRGAHGTTAAVHAAGQTVWPGVQQCEVTTTGTVGTVGDIGYGVRSFQQTVAPIVSSTLPGLISTTAGTGVPGSTGDGGAATSARLNTPEGVEVDRQGLFLYIADNNNHRIRRVNLATGVITTVAGNGTACPGTGGGCGNGGLATAAQLDNPQDIALNPQGTILYIADTDENRIRQVNLSTGIITNFAGTGAACAVVAGCAALSCGDGGLATVAQLNSPRGVDVDSQGNVYIADTSQNRIRRVVLSTGIIENVAGCSTGTAGNIPLGAGSSTTALARFRAPEGIVVSLNDNIIYVADTQTGAAISKVRVINRSAGTVITVAGVNTSAFSGDGAAATSAQLNHPQAVDVDAQGNVYIADTANHRIRKVVTGSDGVVNRGAGENIYAIAGDGTTVFDGDNQDARTASLSSPRGIALDYTFGLGIVLAPPLAIPFSFFQNYYIGDSSHHRVRKVTKVENLEEVDWRELYY